MPIAWASACKERCYADRTPLNGADARAAGTKPRKFESGTIRALGRKLRSKVFAAASRAVKNRGKPNIFLIVAGTDVWS